MQRRARIKPVANLSNQKRGVSKNNTENQQQQEKNESTKKEINELSKDIKEQPSISTEPVRQDEVEAQVVNQVISSDPVKINDDVNKKNDNLEKLNESQNQLQEAPQIASQDSGIDSSINEEVTKEKAENFKSPEKITPRAENEKSVPSNKFRKPKITPRLNISRASTKVQENENEKVKKNDVIIESPILSPVKFEKPPESPVNVFSPPSAPFSPGPADVRTPKTPRYDIPDSPGLIINHHVHHPPTPQSPFYPIPHPRIRTESLCSIKSTTVANLQPRKKVRTEDQKILDNKRESRERLSNKKIEKSQLRMFDMIYYNPTTNPMKPRAAPNPKDKPPKKPLDLTMELPPSPAQKEETPMAVPQLRLNANGEMVLDEASLVVENEEQKKNRILLANTNVVYHDELSGSYGYYKRQQRTKEWSQEETVKFFRCLNTVGTDFSLMLNLFPNRSRRDLKLKFKKEEKNNPNLVDKALLNHNTFDIEELQRELDEEEQMRKKEAENKSSEVKELVKRKILKKQEAKAKARQQDKAKIERILSDGDLVLNSVDNPTDSKENLKKSIDGAISKPKRAPKRKVIKPEPHMEFKKIMLHSQINPAISVVELKSNVGENPQIEEPINMKSPGITAPMSPFVHRHDTSLLSPLHTSASIHSLDSNFDSQPETSMITAKTEDDKKTSTVIDAVISNLPQEAQLETEEHDTLLRKTGRFLSDLITDSYHNSVENVNEYMLDVENKDSECNLKSVKKEEPAPMETIQHLPTLPIDNEEQVLSSNLEVLDMEIENFNDQVEMPVEAAATTTESTYYIVAVEATSNPVEIPIEHNEIPVISEEIPQGPTSPEQISSIELPEPSYIPATPSSPPPELPTTVEPSEDPQVLPEKSYFDPVLAIDSYAERLAHEAAMEGSSSSSIEAVEEVDDETFLNSLDLERLVIVVKQIDGKDSYDIHETEADSEKLSEKPLNLPRHIVDLIVSAMTQDD